MHKYYSKNPQNFRYVYTKSYYLISHHPVCENYYNHTLHLGKLDICIGCFIGYPAAILGILIGYLLIDFLNPIYNLFYPLLIISIIGLSAAFLGFTNLTDHKGIKILQKSLMGGGAGLFMIHTFMFLPFSLWIRVIILLSFFFLFNTPMTILHMKNHNRICDHCQYDPKWNKCPGYRIDKK